MENQNKTIQFKRGTKASLEYLLVDDDKPAIGEPIYETDSGKIKIGDGEQNYSELPYLESSSIDINLINGGNANE